MIMHMDDVTSADVRAVLLAAADLIDRGGWWRSDGSGLATVRTGGTDCHCLVTAVRDATYARYPGLSVASDNLRDAARYKAARAMTLALGLPVVISPDGVYAPIIKANDSYPDPLTGQAWAADVLRRSADYVV